MDDINTLQAQLAQYKSRLTTLKSVSLRDPQNKPALERAVEALTADIYILEARITKAKSDYNKYLDAQETFRRALQNYNLSVTRQLDAEAVYNNAQSEWQVKSNALIQARELADASLTRLQLAQQAKDTAQQNYNSADASLTNQIQITNNSLVLLNEAQSEAQQALTNFNQAQNNLNQAQQDVDEAQHDYDTNLIPDPAWVHPTYQQERTRQVEQTTTQLTGGLTTKVYDRNGYNEAPPMPTANETPIHTTTVPNINYNWQSGQVLNSNRNEDVIVEFKGLISPTTSGYYRFYTPADDGTRLYINNQLLIDDWYDKGGGGSVSEPIYLEANNPVPVTLFYYENGGGAAVSFYYYTPTQGYQIVPAAWLGTQTQTTTTYITETYYTTELVPGATAPLIKNPTLLAILNNKKSHLAEMNSVYNIRLSQRNTANSNLSQADSTYNSELAKQQTAESGRSASWNNLSIATDSLEAAVASKQTLEADLETATTEEASASVAKTQSLTSYNEAQTATSNSLTIKDEAEKTEGEASSIAQASYVIAKQTEGPDFTEAETIASKEPEPQKGSEEIPAELSASNLMSVDLTKVDPTEMTPEQAEQLREAALETFLTADAGSPEYEQALDALYLAAEQDDIVLDPALAAIPGLQAATELVNFLGNAGADMSPKVREDSEKVVVAAVVAAGAAIQSAAAAASTASASTGSGSRR